jgi:hypothetical protein
MDSEKTTIEEPAFTMKRRRLELNKRLGAAGALREARNATTVQRLLEKGADVNVQGGRYGNALQAASYGGHEQSEGHSDKDEIAQTPRDGRRRNL